MIEDPDYYERRTWREHEDVRLQILRGIKERIADLSFADEFDWDRANWSDNTEDPDIYYPE